VKTWVLPLLVVACTSPAVPPPVAPVAPPVPVQRPYRVPERSRDVAIAVTARGVTINGARVPMEPTVADLERLLGKADRVNDKPANVLHTWDRLGILVYEPHDGRAQTVGLIYTQRGMDFDPKQLYEGRASIDGNPLDRSVTFRTVQGYPGHGGSGSYGSSATFKHGTVEVYVGADGTDDPVRVVEVSFYNGASAGTPDDDPEDTTPSPSAPRDVRGHEAACNRGEAQRCTRAGIIYQNGARGVTRNDRRAFAFLRKACSGGDAFGCTALGVAHATGRGTERSQVDAIEMFRKACKLGDSVACSLAKTK
jgi:hypothetical protein